MNFERDVMFSEEESPNEGEVKVENKADYMRYESENKRSKQNAEYKRKRINEETPEEQQYRLEVDAQYKRIGRVNETFEQRNNRLEVEAQRSQMRRTNETPEQRHNRLQLGQTRRANETPEQRNNRLEVEAQRSQMRRANETPEQCHNRLEVEAQRSQMRRANETPEQRHNRLQQGQTRMANETPEQRQSKLHLKAQRQRTRRANETPEQRQIQLHLNAQRERTRRANETSEQRQNRNNKNSLRGRMRRANETPDQRKIRLQTRKEQSKKRLAEAGINQAEAGINQAEAITEEANEEVSVNIGQVIQATTVPDIAQYVETINSLKCAQKHLLNTKIDEECAGNEQGECHQANVCVCCDRFITGTSEIGWISKTTLIQHHNRLQDKRIPEALRSCYRVQDPELHEMLLSPRSRVNVQGCYVCCMSCVSSLRPSNSNKVAPKYSIANRWAIGTLPTDVSELVTEVTGPLMSYIRPFAYVMSFTGGAHKSITGSFTFFSNNVQQNVGALNQHANLTGSSSVYVFLSGRFTTHQRALIKKRCLVEVEHFLTVYNWLRSNNVHYADMLPISECPTPQIFEDEAVENNTDESENPEVEKQLDFQYFFPSHEEPNRSTATFQSEESFLKAYMEGKEPTLVFSSSAYVNDWKVTLSQLFPLYFPYGIGDMKDELRENKVSEVEAIKHYLRLSLPQFQKADFILVLGHILFRKLAFQSASVRCMSRAGHDGISLGEAFSTVKDSDILQMSNINSLRDPNLANYGTLPATLLHTVKTSCKNVPYSDEATIEARTKLFGLWMSFGPPSIFFTISPSDECSFRVLLFCNTSRQYLPSVDCSENECISNMLFQTRARTDNPGACAREFNALWDIIMEALIGWDRKKGRQTRDGIFGKVNAFGDTVEEQGRKTLHSHMLLFIDQFDKLMMMLWSSEENVKEQAMIELTKYFEKIMNSSYGLNEKDLIHVKGNSNVGGVFYSSHIIRTSEENEESMVDCTGEVVCQIKETNDQTEMCRVEPIILDKQVLRNMRQKEMAKIFQGIVAYCPVCFKQFSTTSLITTALSNWYEVAKEEDPELLPSFNLQFPLTKARQELFAIRFPYDMDKIFESDRAIKKFLLAVANMRFNEHDWKHRPGCFKKGCECRFDFPRNTNERFQVVFGPEESKGKWYRVYKNGLDIEAKGFSLESTRGIPDVFLNTHNRNVSLLLGYNNNVMSGGRDMIYYVTLYTTKTNQKEESFPFYKQCVAISKRITRLRMLENQVNSSLQSVGDTIDANVEPSYSVGLGHVLSGISAHLTTSVISATMAWHLIMNGSRFRYSHEFSPILLSQMEDWLVGRDISFRYRRSKQTGQGWLDSSLMNYLFRPLNEGLDNLCVWEFFMQYELILKSSLGKSKRNNEEECDEEENNETETVNWDFIEGHPGRAYACLKKMQQIKIPILYYKKELPDLEDCSPPSLDCDTNEPSVIKTRNEYATIMLLLFYPFRDTFAFGEEQDRWKLFCELANSGKLYNKSRQIMQNIQDIHNSKKLVKPKDQLLLETELQRLNKQHVSYDDEDSCENSQHLQHTTEDNEEDDNMEHMVEEMAYIRSQMEKEVINEICTTKTIQLQEKFISKISCDINQTVIRNNDGVDVEHDGNSNALSIQHPTFIGKSVIQIIMDFNRRLTPEDTEKIWTLDNMEACDTDNPKEIVNRLDAGANLMKLDLYQKAAFDIICSSFMLKYLERTKQRDLPDYQDAKKQLFNRGGEEQLIMFLSGAGGCGKSHVIGAIKAMCQHFCRSINRGNDTSAFIVTASTNSAAALLRGNTIHSVAQLRSKFSNVSSRSTDVNIQWSSVTLIVIDEISMLSKSDFIKLDKHLRKIMREVTNDESRVFGGLHLVLCGDFFQLNPVLATPIYDRNTNALWNLINHVVFLKGSNFRFFKEPSWGERLDRIRLGLMNDADYDFLDMRVIGPNLCLPSATQLDGKYISYACPTNALRNRITDQHFASMLQQYHPTSNDVQSIPSHSIIIKGIFLNKRGGCRRSEHFHRLVYNNCGDDKVIMRSNSGRVDPCLKLTVGSPVMVSDFKNADKSVVKGVTGLFVGIDLLPGLTLREEIWDGYKILTVDATDVQHIIVERSRKSTDDPISYFSLPTKKFSVDVKLPIGGSNHITLSDMEIVQFPINLDQATTGHKLQGMTKDYLAVADYNYSENWIYVTLSRVTTSTGLFLFKPLNRAKRIGPSEALLREIENLEAIERESLTRLQRNGHFPDNVDLSLGIMSTIRGVRGSCAVRNIEDSRRTGSTICLANNLNTLLATDSCQGSIEGILGWFPKVGMDRVTGNEFVYTVGNCLYDSVAYLVPEWQDDGIMLRCSTISWAQEELKKDESHWAETLVEMFYQAIDFHEVTYGKQTVEEYLDFITDPTVYATTLDIYMLSNFLQIGIEIYSHTSPSSTFREQTVYLPNREFSEMFQSNVSLFYDNNILHYEPIVKLN